MNKIPWKKQSASISSAVDSNLNKNKQYFNIAEVLQGMP